MIGKWTCLGFYPYMLHGGKVITTKKEAKAVGLAWLILNFWLFLHDARVNFTLKPRAVEVTIPGRPNDTSFTVPVGSEHKCASNALAFAAETLQARLS